MLDKDPRTIQKMFAEIAPRYDRANHLLSMRFDVGWRKAVAGQLLRHGGRVLDLAAGTGDLTVDLARYGGHRVISGDFTFEMLVEGKSKVAAAQATQIAADALALPFRESSFDGVAVAFGIRNFADALGGLVEMKRVLRRGGACGILEFSTPARGINFAYDFYFRRILPRLGGIISGSRAPYEYLPKSVAEFPQGESFIMLMESAGFVNVTRQRMSGGIVTFYRGEKP